MSKEDRYFTAPLSMLRSGQSALEALETCLSYAIVDAGIGYRKVRGEDAFEQLLSRAKQRTASKQGFPCLPPKKFNLKIADGARMSESEALDFWRFALAGWELFSITGGNRLEDAQTWLSHHREKAVFFKIKSDWLWSALHTARHEAGKTTEHNFKPISWREFRILAAILSAPVNTLGFVFVGWESIQARASGFHTKALFNAEKATLPAHCQPLTRQMIRDACEALEALNFYARCRYAKGDRGGLNAYSVRHPKREDLQAAVNKWADANRSFGTKAAEFRASDKLAFKRTK